MDSFCPSAPPFGFQEDLGEHREEEILTSDEQAQGESTTEMGKLKVLFFVNSVE